MARKPVLAKDEKKLFELAEKGITTEFVDLLDKFLMGTRRIVAGDINVQNERGRTFLHFAAAKGDRLMAQHLLNVGARGDLCDLDSFLPLHMAVWTGSRDVAQMLVLKFPHLINARTEDGCGILHYCLTGNNCEEDDILFFIQHGVDLSMCNRAGESALLKAVHFGRLSQASVILEQCHRQLERPVLMELLKPTVMLCARFARHSILQQCFRIGFDVNYLGPEGTALHVAVDCGRLETVQFLLLQGANPKVVNFSGESVVSLLNSGKLRLSQALIYKMKRLVHCALTGQMPDSNSEMPTSVSAPTTPVDMNPPLMTSLSVPCSQSSVPQPSSCTTPLGHKEGAQTNVGDGDRGSPSCLLSSGGGGDSTISNRSSMRIGFGGQGGQSLDEYHDPHPLTDIHRKNPENASVGAGNEAKRGEGKESGGVAVAAAAAVEEEEDYVYMDMTGLDLSDDHAPLDNTTVQTTVQIPLPADTIIDDSDSVMTNKSEDRDNTQSGKQTADVYDYCTEVYGNGRMAEDLFVAEKQSWETLGEQHSNNRRPLANVADQEGRLSKVYSDEKTEEADCDQNVPASTSPVAIQRNAFSVVNMACSQQLLDDEYCDEYSGDEQENEELGNGAADEDSKHTNEEEPNPYASLLPFSDRPMSEVRKSRQGHSILLSDNARNVDWEFIDDILHSVGIHARDSRFDPDLFALRVERSISESKKGSPETVGQWLWLLQLRHLEPLFLANGYDDILFIGPDVLTADSLRFMGIEDEGTMDRILQSDAVLNCSLVPKLHRHLQGSKTETETETSIADWLRVLHLSRYEDNFSAAGCHHLQHLTHAWQLALAINKFGISLLGHRRRLLASLDVKQLKTQLNTFLRQSRIGKEDQVALEMKSEENDGAADECRDSFSMNKKEDTAPQRIFSRDADRNTCVSSFVATTTTSRGKTAEKGPSPQPEETAENSRRQLLLLTSDEDHSARHRSPQCEQTLEASSSSPIKTSTSSNTAGVITKQQQRSNEECSGGEGEERGGGERPGQLKGSRSSLCKSVTLSQLNEVLKELEGGNEVSVVAASDDDCCWPTVMDEQSSASTPWSAASAEAAREETRHDNAAAQPAEKHRKNKREDSSKMRAFSNLSSLKPSSFKVGFLGVVSFEGVEPSEQALLSACRTRLAKGVQAVPLVTIHVSFSSLRLLDPKGNIAMEHAVTNVQCAAMSSDHKTFAYVVIERKPPSSSWRPLIRRNAPSEFVATEETQRLTQQTAVRAHRMCYIFQALKDGGGQEVMTALKTSFEAAYAFVSSMTELSSSSK